MFYGWRIVGIAAAAQAVSAGGTYFVYGLFVKPLAEEFDAPRLVVVLGLTLLMAIQGLVSPALGRALDGRSIRAIMSLGALCCALGFLGLSASTALWQVGVLFGTLIAVGSHMFGPISTATLVANWFVRTRGRALGITAVGASLGGLTFPVMIAALMERFGWRGAAVAVALGMTVFALPLWLVIVNRPEDIGTGPDGEARNSEPSDTPTQPAEDVPLIRSLNFWAITATIGLAFCPVSVMLAHLIPYATDLGYEPKHAALLMSAYGGAGVLGRLLFGFLADRIDKRVTAWIAFTMLGVAWTALVTAPSYPWLLAASIGMGVGVGGIMPLWGSLTGACFGRAVFGRAMGLMNPLMLPFNLAGAPLAAWTFDRTGSYTAIFSALLLCFVLGALAVALLRLPRVEPGTTS